MKFAIKTFLCLTIDWLHSIESKNCVIENKPPEVVNAYLFLKWNFWVTYCTVTKLISKALSLSYAEEYGKDNTRGFFTFSLRTSLSFYVFTNFNFPNWIYLTTFCLFCYTKSLMTLYLIKQQEVAWWLIKMKDSFAFKFPTKQNQTTQSIRLQIEGCVTVVFQAYKFH
jgi:hypothetical protein